MFFPKTAVNSSHLYGVTSQKSEALMCVVLRAVWCVALPYTCEFFIAPDAQLCSGKFEHFILISVLNIDQKVVQT
jgi:hypothetical protein